MEDKTFLISLEVLNATHEKDHIRVLNCNINTVYDLFKHTKDLTIEREKLKEFSLEFLINKGIKAEPANKIVNIIDFNLQFWR